MNYWKLLDAVLESDPEHWQRVNTGPGTLGPWDSLWVYGSDVAISLALGAPHNQGEGWTHEKWSHAFPDRKVYGHYAELRYNGSPAHADLLLSVDGGRAVLPSGRLLDGGAGMAATRQEMAFARLVDQIERGARSQFQDYVDRANISLD